MKRREYHKHKQYVPIVKIVLIGLSIVFIFALFVNVNKTKDDWKHNGTVQSSENVQSNTSKIHIRKDQWELPSENVPYPNIQNCQDLNILVSLRKQRVYIKNNDTTLYTMICSSGIDDTTPKGTFYVCDRGKSFFNRKLNEGANYWTSFTTSDVYLFHTVPTKEDGSYNIPQAEKLGKPASHGCIRLSVPDAKWIYENIPNGTEVVIE